MKVAIFTDTFMPQINGVTKTLSKLIEYMEARDIQYRVFAPAFKNSTSNDNIIRFNSIKFLLYPQCRLAIPRYSFVKKELDLFQPDIIHLVTEFNLGLCGLKYAKAHNIPVVSSYETNIPQYLKYYHLIFLENTSWLFFKWFHGSCDVNYCPSEATLKLLQTKGLNRVDIWERGIEVNNFSPDYRDEGFRESLGINDKIVFLYVGRVSPEKDLDVFIEVAKRLNHRYMDKVEFMVVGDGPSLKKLRKEVPENFTFTGFVRGHKLAKIYASSDIFMFTSPTETLGFVVLEAMASGLPLICCDVGGVTENLKDGYNGIACREKSVDDFYNAAEKLINDNDLRKNLAENARRYVMKKDWDNAFDNLIESYKTVIKNKFKGEYDGNLVGE